MYPSISHTHTQKMKVFVAQSCPTLCDPIDSSLCPWNSSSKNTGVGSHSLLQGYLPNPEMEPQVSYTTGSFFTVQDTSRKICQ